LRRRQQDVRLLAVGLRPAAQVRQLGEDETPVTVHASAIARYAGMMESSWLAICFHAAAGDEG